MKRVRDPSAFVFMSGSIGELIRYLFIGFSIRNWVLPSYIVTDQNAFTGGSSPGEGQGVIMFAAVQRLSVGQQPWSRDTSPRWRCCRKFPLWRPQRASANRRCSRRDRRKRSPRSSHLLLFLRSRCTYQLRRYPSFMPNRTAALCSRERSFMVEGLAWTDANARQPGADSYFLRARQENTGVQNRAIPKTLFSQFPRWP